MLPLVWAVGLLHPLHRQPHFSAGLILFDSLRRRGEYPFRANNVVRRWGPGVRRALPVRSPDRRQPIAPPRGVFVARGGLPPTPVAEPADDPLLVSALCQLRQASTNRVVQRLVCEDVDEDREPRHAHREGIHLPQMDHGRAPIFPEVGGEKAEGDSEPKEPPALGLRDNLELPARDLRPAEIEEPRDPAIAQWMEGIEIGHRAHRGVRLCSYSNQAFRQAGNVVQPSARPDPRARWVSACATRCPRTIVRSAPATDVCYLVESTLRTRCARTARYYRAGRASDQRGLGCPTLRGRAYPVTRSAH